MRKGDTNMTRGNNRKETTKRMILAAMAALLVLCTAACGKANKDKDIPDASSETGTGVSEMQDTGTPEPEAVKVKTAVVDDITGTLNIRSEPNTDCEILGSAKAGDEFEVITELCQPGWHEVAYKGGKAYVSAEYVKISEEIQTAPTPTPDPDAPIVVNGSGREDVSEDNADEGMTADSIKETEDPARR